MDILTFHNPNGTMLMEQGEIVNGIKSKMWVERYAESGEFRFTAPVSAQLRTKFPVGSFVSHTDTTELMIVEDHQIEVRENAEPQIIITGRGLETYLEQRIVGANRVEPRFLSDSDSKFLLPAQKTWDQVVHIINQHISPAFLINDQMGLPYITTRTTLTGAGVVTSRRVEIKDLYSAVLDLLSIDNLGIRVVRPGVWSPLTGAAAPNTAIIIHRGLDRSATIIFNNDTGEIVNADYLWSNKKLKTWALVTSKYFQTLVHLSGQTNYNCRVMQVDATTLDDNWTDSEAIVELLSGGVNIFPKMEQKGREALRKQPEINLTKAEVSKRTVETRYRVDFNVGDLVRVVGDYNENAKMRVTEFVEIEDETGTQAYPTLSLDSGD